MVQRHKSYRSRPENTDPIQLAVIEQHAAEGQVVRQRRDQSAGSREVRSRPSEGAIAGIVDERVRGRALARAVISRKAIQIRIINTETGVQHAEWAKKAILEVSIEWQSAEYLAEVADNVRRDAIDELRARVGPQWEILELAHQFGER